MTNDFGAFLAQFAEVRDEGRGDVVVPCPAHADGSPSLVLAVKADGRMIMHCRAGCQKAAVLAALDLHERDLFGWTAPDGVTVKSGGTSVPGPGPGEIAALAVYVDRTSGVLADAATSWADTAREYVAARFGLDADTARELALGVDTGGGPAFAHVSGRYSRYPRLTVPFHGFDGVPRGLQGRDLSGQCSARWVSLTNPEGMTWSRYGVFRSGGSYGTYLVTEGPGDALTAVGVGYDAVAVRGASLASSPALVAELADGLQDGHVIIAGDNDDAGRSFTATLAAALRERGVTAHTLEIPHEGDDLTDWRARDPEAFPDALHEAVRLARPVAAPAEVQADERAAELDAATGTDVVSRDDGRHAAELLAAYMDRYGDTDVLRAHALVAFVEGRVRYASGLGFHVWTGRRWERSDTRVRQEIHRMGAALAMAGRPAEAKGFLNTSKIESLMSELRAVPAVHVDASDFDAQPHLLTVRNGTIDLRTGVIRPHSMGDLITQMVDLEYRPDTTAPRWEQFLGEIFPGDHGLPGFMQRLVGYGITGSTAEQCFAVLWGKGANGKSVFMDTLTDVFGAVSRTTPFSTFEEKPNGGIPNDLAALRGARLVRASEGEQGKPMAESVLKRATGSDVMSARFLRQEFFEFKPAFLLMMDTNHKPRFKGQDEGIWRRVKMVPFSRWFAPAERDHRLPERLRAEAAGILAWAVRGAVEWYANGLQDPDVIRDATREYRETSDALAGFFPGVLEPSDDDDTIPGTDAFVAYLDWCEAENLPARERWTRRGFYAAMEERGIYRKKTRVGVVLFGIRLVANTPADGTHNENAGTDVFGQSR
ncbi:phage/plasmid primase, P4 family [Nocardiopsis alba]|uniref:phage/plasmid primase, P4 family n=1 Tax=Nocardiopsis alba TaxID=53437 RepID=UPI003D713CFB